MDSPYLGWVVSGLSLLFAFLSISVKKEQDLVCICLVHCCDATSTCLVERPCPCLLSLGNKRVTEELGTLQGVQQTLFWGRACVWHRRASPTRFSECGAACCRSPWAAGGCLPRTPPSPSVASFPPPLLSRPVLSSSMVLGRKQEAAVNRETEAGGLQGSHGAPRSPAPGD